MAQSATRRHPIVVAVLCALWAVQFHGLSLDASAEQAQSRDPTLNYARDIAPILSAHCTACHRPGGGAPFSLLTYTDVVSRATQIREAVRTRVMPPWKPEPGYGVFQDERRLSEPNLASVVSWIDAGTPAGDLAAVSVAVPETVAEEPDLVVAMDEVFVVPASGADIFRNFVVPLNVGGRRLVRAWEFRPGNDAVVHHATVGFDTSGASRELDARDPAPGYEGIVSFSVQNPDGYFLGWSPGQRQPQRAAPGMAWPLESGADLLISMHLRPTGREERVRASIAFYFTDDAPARVPVMLRLGRQDIDIPAGASTHVISNSYRLPVDVELLSVYPHAHHLAREVKAWAMLPDGAREELLYIRDWDFNWQDVYRYAAPVRLPSGSTLTMEYTYDNSGSRAHAGHGPPVRVTFGPNSSDEMGDLWMQVVTRRQQDRAGLVADFERKLLPETLAGVEMMLQASPGNLALHNDAGLLYQQTGRPDLAETHFAEVLRRVPTSAPALGNLASVLLAQGKTEDARRYARRAIDLDPTLPSAHFTMGFLLHLDGDRVAAIAEYRRTLALRPSLAEAHHLLASALGTGGASVESDEHYREAIRLRPDWPVPLIELAWSLATRQSSSPEDVREALQYARAAVTLSLSSAPLDALGAVLARAGDFAGAIRAATDAQTRARAEGDLARAAQIGERLTLYRQARPFLQRE